MALARLRARHSIPTTSQITSSPLPFVGLPEPETPQASFAALNFVRCTQINLHANRKGRPQGCALGCDLDELKLNQ